MKAIIAISIIALTLLFFTRYDLYEAEDSITDSYSVVETGFYRMESCIAKGKSLKNPYKCIGHNAWGNLTKKNRDYNKEREID